MAPLLGNPTISSEALETMRSRGGDWFAFQSHDMSSATLGDLQFLQCGPECTYKTPPERMPDTQHGLGWRFLLVGKVNLESGEIEKAL